MKTIVAISSPIGAGGIGIVRVSGNDALGIADAIFNFGKETTRVRTRAQHNNDSLNEQSCPDGASHTGVPTNAPVCGVNQPWEPLKMHFGTFVAKDFCDRGYAVYFPASKAYTGEDTVEFYLHGGVRIMRTPPCR